MPPDAANKTYEDALKLCAAPWRLPSRIELVTLLDHSRTGAKINAAFAGALQAPHWTSSEVRIRLDNNVPALVDPPQFWVVDFDKGGLDKRDPASTAAVRCVKDEP